MKSNPKPKHAKDYDKMKKSLQYKWIFLTQTKHTTNYDLQTTYYELQTTDYDIFHGFKFIH